MKNEKTYAVRQTDNGIHCAITLKEMVTVWIIVLALELDILRCGAWVAIRGNVPPSGIGDVRNRSGRTPLCIRRQIMSVKNPEKRLRKAKTDNVHRARGARVSRQVPGAFALRARNRPIVHGQSSLACGENKSEAECR